MMMHNHAMFGYKVLNHSEDLIWTIFNKVLNLDCDLDLEHSKAVFLRIPWLTMRYHQSLVTKGSAVQKI